MNFAKTFWLNDEIIGKLKILVLELAEKYKIQFHDNIDYFTDHINIEYIEGSKEHDHSKQYRHADMLLKFCSLKGDATIRTAREALNIDSEFLKQIQLSLIDEEIEILNSLELYGYSESEKHGRISELAEREKQEEEKIFKTKINGTMNLLRGFKNIFK